MRSEPSVSRRVRGSTSVKATNAFPGGPGRVASLALSCWLWILPSLSWSGSPIQVQIDTISMTSFPRVDVKVLLLDPGGTALGTLTEKNIRVTEDGRREKIQRLRIDRTPVYAVLALDTSGSMVTALDAMRTAAARFIRSLGREDRAEIIAFADEERIVAPLSGRRQVLLRALAALAPYGATALHDALFRAVSDLAPLPGRRVVVALTDGNDQNRDGTGPQSRHTLDEVLKKARDSRVSIHTVGLGPHVNRKELQRMARSTGGRAHFASGPSALLGIYEIIAANLRSQLVISYTTRQARHDGSWRRVEIAGGVGDSQGSGSARYRAPGRYVMDVEGQGYDRLRLSAMASEDPRVHLLDLDLESLFEGTRERLSSWLESYFVRPEE